MKHGKCLTVAQKLFLQSQGMTKEESNQYLVVKNTSDELVVVHRDYGDPIRFKKINLVRWV